MIARRTRVSAAALSLVLAAALTACSGTVMPSPTAVPLRPTATADFSTTTLTELLDALIAAGAPAAIIEVREGDKVWQHATGVASIRTETPAEAGMRFRIASLTKPLVAAVVLQLVAEGRLELDDRAAELLPGPLDGAFANVTVRQLLNHTSGLQDYIDQLVQGDPTQVTSTLSTPRPAADLLALATAKGPAAEPGAAFLYSNANYIALTMLIEHLEGRPLAESLNERIITPLGLTSTRLPEGSDLGDPHVHGYWINGSVSVDVTKQDASLWSGAGGLESTVADVNTFFRALTAGLVVPAELLGEMLALGADGYGLGVQGRVDTCGAGDAVTLPVTPKDVPLATDGREGPTEPAPEDGDAAPTVPGDGDGVGGDDADVAAPVESGGAADEPADPADATDGPAPADPDASHLAATDAASHSGSIIASAEGNAVQIGDPGYVYGHLGSGLGYRALTFSTPDGIRQVTIAWTASPTDYATDPRLPIAYEIVDAALSVGCR